MKNAGLRNTMIAKILGILYSEEYGLLTRQIKSIYKRPSRLVNKITELKEYCNENQIFIFFFPEESNPLAIFIVTQNELENGTKHGDFSVIGSTHWPNIFQFGIGPITLLDSNLKNRCLGVLFHISSITEVFTYLLRTLIYLEYPLCTILSY